MRTALPATTLLLALAAAGGCRDTAGPAPVPKPAAELTIAGGDGQSAPSGAMLPDPLAVRVVDADGAPVEGQPVAWSVEERGGEVDADTTRTGEDGIARARWTMGGFSGTWTATAQTGELPPVTFQATATGPVQVRIVAPADSVRTDSVRLEVEVQKDERPVEVVASTADRSVVLKRGDGDIWSGVLALDGLDRAAYEVVVTATNDRGKAAVAVLTVINDARPRVRIVSPELPRNAGRVLAGSVPVTAVCEDDDPGGCALRILMVTGVGASQLGAGTDSVTATFSAVGRSADSVRFRVVAADSGGEVSVETGAFGIQPDPRWTEVLYVPGKIEDATPRGALYGVNGAPDTGVRFYRASDGLDVGLRPHAILTADGALHAILPDMNGNYYGVQQVGGSGIEADYACCITASGNWAGYLENDGRFLRENVLVPGYLPAVRVGVRNESFALGSDGSVIYTFVDRSSDRPTNLLRVSAGGVTVQLTTEPGVRDLWPSSDGGVVVFVREWEDRPEHQLMAVQYGGVEPLTPVMPTTTGFSYDVTGDWAAWTMRDLHGLQVWRRAPSGSRTKLTSGPGDSRLLSISENGEVIFRRGGRVLVTGRFRETDMGPESLRLKWVRGELYAIVESSLFHIDR